jgi:phytoene dehydrogenase-like protein
MPDAVIIGSGPNGLVAANLLVDEGWSVDVLEGQPDPGGSVRSQELIEPRFLNDLCSSFYPLVQGSPAFAGLDLERHGLVWRRSPLVLAHPSGDGTCVTLGSTPEETAAGLEQFALGDGDAWRRLHDRWRRVREPLLGSLLQPFPPVRAGLQLAVRLRSDLLRFARFTLLPVRRLGEEEFTSPQARRLLAGSALHGDLAPENTLSGFYGWLLSMLGQDYGFPQPEGGAGEVTAALVRRLKHRGGRLHTATPVTGIVIEGRRARAVRTAGGDIIPADGAVLADVDAPTLYRHLVGAEHLPHALLADLERFHRDHSTLKIDWTLDAPIPWLAPEARRAGTIHLADDVNALTTAEAQLACGFLPERPFVILGQQSMTDPSRQPAGCETVWAYTHLPPRPVGDALGQISTPLDRNGYERLADRVQAQIERLAPGFGSLVRGRKITSPAELHEHNANLVDGAIAGGTSQLHQQLMFRPVPGWGRAETPIAGLYLASASAHPGGGVHGACGANAARAAMWHHRLRSVTFWR